MFEKIDIFPVRVFVEKENSHIFAAS